MVVRYAYNLTSNASVPGALSHSLRFNATYDTAAMTSTTEIVLPNAVERRGTVQATSAVNINGTHDITIDPLTAPQGAATGFEWVTIGINHNEPPFADTDGNKTVKPGTVIYFDASTSSDDTSIANFTWDFGDGTTGYGVTVNHTYNVTNGTPKAVFIVVLKVTDTGGLMNKTTATVTIDGSNPVANFDISNFTVVERTQPVEVNASGVNSSSDNVGIARYSWDWGDGTSGEGAVTNHTYFVPGTYNLTLNVTDQAGNWANKTVVITVLDNTSPVARFISNVTVAPAGMPIDFNGTTSTDNVAVVQWVWDFGDGSAKVSGNASVADVNHTYAAEGTYNVTLNVTDGLFFNETTVKITVTPPLIFADINTTSLRFSKTDPTTDDTVTISVKITNQGQKSAENFTVRFQAGSKKIGDVKVRSLAIGQAKTVSVDWKTTKKGTYTITVSADAGSVIAESNETNNVVEGKLTVKESQMSLIIGVVAVLVVIGIVVGFFLYTRRSKKEYDEDEEEEEEEDEEEDEEESDEDEEAEEMECPKCFAEVKPTDKKCPSCGANIRR
jgi:PKD repeat protein